MQVIQEILSDYILVILLFVAAVYFTYTTGGVQFRMVGEMFRLLLHSGKHDNDLRAKSDSQHSISSFQAFMLSIASRVGTGNLAGVATAIAIGGPGAVFWMWVIALLGSATAFIESTLAQLYKVKGDRSFVGGPAYYILHGLKKKWWAMTFAVLIIVTFSLAFNSVQSNTIASAFQEAFKIDPNITGIALTVLTIVIIFGGIQSIARFSEVVVPFMAIAYILLAAVIVVMNFDKIPGVFSLIVGNALGFGQATGGAVGVAIMWGVKRGLFSNEAGEGSTPNAAATASVSHPVKQGLIQALGVYTDTLIICSCTAFIILCSGAFGTEGLDGIVLTQHAIDSEIGGNGFGKMFVSVAIFFFAFTSIIANYYYGEANLTFITKERFWLFVFRLVVAYMVMTGSVSELNFVWGLADITMALMTICNISAIALLGKYAVRCLDDYIRQKRQGKDPVYKSSTIPEIASDTPSW